MKSKGGKETMGFTRDENKIKTRDEAFQQFKEALAEIDKQAREATLKARATLHEQLAILRDEYHKELKAIRAISQKTKRRREKCLYIL